MRHGKKFNHLGRTAPHRRAMLSNMASSLILNKRISTTVAKAKALRKYVEPLLTKAKNDTTHSRRVVFSYLNNKDSVKTLFDDVAGKIATRPGGYTRILKTGNRLGDNAEMCIIELVDYNEALLKEAAPSKSRTRRSRRRGKGKAEADATVSKEKSGSKDEVKTEKEKDEVKTEAAATEATADMKKEAKDEKVSTEAKKDEAAEAKADKGEAEEEKAGKAKSETSDEKGDGSSDGNKDKPEK